MSLHSLRNLQTSPTKSCLNLMAAQENSQMLPPSVDRTRSQPASRHAARRQATFGRGVDRFTLRLRLLRGRNLPVGDTNGKSDPYVVVRAADQKWRSTTRSKTLDPEWNAEFSFEWLSFESSLWLSFEVFDADLVAWPVRSTAPSRRHGRPEAWRLSATATGCALSGVRDHTPVHARRRLALPIADHL